MDRLKYLSLGKQLRSETVPARAASGSEMCRPYFAWRESYYRYSSYTLLNHDQSQGLKAHFARADSQGEGTTSVGVFTIALFATCVAATATGPSRPSKRQFELCTSTRLQQGMHSGASWDLTHRRSGSDVLPDLIYEDCVRERHYVCGKLVAGVRVVFRE